MQIEIAKLQPKDGWYRFTLVIHVQVDHSVAIYGCRYYPANDEKPATAFGPSTRVGPRFYDLAVFSPAMKEKVLEAIQEEVRDYEHNSNPRHSTAGTAD